MKKLAVLLALAGILTLAASMVQARSEWAKFKENPVYRCEECSVGGEVVTEDCYTLDDYKGPRVFIFDSEVTYYSEEGCDEFTVTDFTLDCTACHGPDAPGNHDGPQLPGGKRK